MIKKESYYTRELNKVQTNSDYAPTVQIVGANGERTKHLSINKESAKDLIKWLQDNFIVNPA